jgi:hypothetical protein
MAPTFAHTVNTDQATFLGFGLEAIFYGVSRFDLYDDRLT